MELFLFGKTVNTIHIIGSGLTGETVRTSIVIANIHYIRAFVILSLGVVPHIVQKQE